MFSTQLARVLNKTMLQRQEKLFKLIVEEYLKTAEPVGSLKLSTSLKISSATVRNEMMELEEAHLIFQPHISAGRIPTEKGYIFYIQKFILDKSDLSLEKKLTQTANSFSADEKIKILAKAIVELANEAVVVAFNENQLYYTGLSCLFSKPEFSLQSMVTDLSQILDHCEEVMPEVIGKINQNQKILLGSNNPFGRNCSFVGTTLPGYEKGILGILGPLRMDYQKNLSLINSLNKILS
ncbi:MAG TPA: hypothetical protein PKY08_00250 [Candidatus Magasanikbacteria bacterium]|nr:hypothetical protein [Candidatus Magasanikbacteria bacterium]